MKYPFLSILLTCFSLWSQEVISQVKIKVVSQEDGKALPYCTVGVFPKGVVYSSNQEGEVSLNLHEMDTVKVSHIGYKEEMFVVSRERNITLKLSRLIKNLSMVSVSNCRATEKRTKQNFTKHGPPGGYLGAYLKFAKTQGGYCTFLKPDDANSILKSISFWISSDGNPIYPATSFYVTFYQTDSLGNPGLSILEEPILFHPQRDGRQVLTLDTIKLRVPNEGYFIGFHPIKFEKADSNNTFVHVDSEKGIRIVGSDLGGMPSFIFDYRNNKWVSLGNNCVVKLKEVYLTCPN